MTFPPNSFFCDVLPYHDHFLPKTKMVRMVYMNIFYRMDLEMCDLKSEFWTNTEKIGRSKNWKIGLRSNMKFQRHRWCTEAVNLVQEWNSKYSDFEFYCEITSSGPSHSIRLVKLIWKKSVFILSISIFPRFYGVARVSCNTGGLYYRLWDVPPSKT